MASIFGDNATLFVALCLLFTLPAFPRVAASWPGRRSRFPGGPVRGASVIVAHLCLADIGAIALQRRDRKERSVIAIAYDEPATPFMGGQLAGLDGAIKAGPAGITGRSQSGDCVETFWRWATAPSFFSCKMRARAIVGGAREVGST
jgi:hypothetical protein